MFYIRIYVYSWSILGCCASIVQHTEIASFPRLTVHGIPRIPGYGSSFVKPVIPIAHTSREILLLIFTVGKHGACNPVVTIFVVVLLRRQILPVRILFCPHISIQTSCSFPSEGFPFNIFPFLIDRPTNNFNLSSLITRKSSDLMIRLARRANITFAFHIVKLLMIGWNVVSTRKIQTIKCRCSYWYFLNGTVPFTKWIMLTFMICFTSWKVSVCVCVFHFEHFPCNVQIELKKNLYLLSTIMFLHQIYN